MIEVRPLSDTREIAELAPIEHYAFGVPTEQAVEWLTAAGEEHVRLAYRTSEAGGRQLVGGLIHIPMGHFVGGRSVPTLGIAGVVVAPEARGLGVAKALMSASLREAAERGVALSSLYPATVTLYRAVGYELAGSRHRFRARVADLAGLLPAGGSVVSAADARPPVTRHELPVSDAAALGPRHELPASDARPLVVRRELPASDARPPVTRPELPASDARPLVTRHELPVSDARPLVVRRELPEEEAAVHACYERFARHRCGFLDRGPYVWRRTERQRVSQLPAHRFVAVSDAGVEGYARLALTRNERLHLDLQLLDYAADHAAATAALVRLLADHRSTADTVSWHGGIDDPIAQLAREHAFTAELAEYWMVRVVDVAAALATRGYPLGLGARVVLAVDDPLLAANAGSYALEVDSGSGRCARTDDGPAVRIDIRGLGALFTGFASPRELVERGHRAGDPAALDLLAALFPKAAPSMRDMF